MGNWQFGSFGTSAGVGPVLLLPRPASRTMLRIVRRADAPYNALGAIVQYFLGIMLWLDASFFFMHLTVYGRCSYNF